MQDDVAHGSPPDPTASPSAARFDVFVYGSLLDGGAAAHLLDGCERITTGTVGGVLYDIDGRYPALLLYGHTSVHGEVWRCHAGLLRRLDEYEGTGDRLFRRVGVEVETSLGTMPCWVYSAGPALSRKLVPAMRIPGGRWPV